MQWVSSFQGTYLTFYPWLTRVESRNTVRKSKLLPIIIEDENIDIQWPKKYRRQFVELNEGLDPKLHLLSVFRG